MSALGDIYRWADHKNRIVADIPVAVQTELLCLLGWAIDMWADLRMPWSASVAAVDAATTPTAAGLGGTRALASPHRLGADAKPLGPSPAPKPRVAGARGRHGPGEHLRS